MTDFRIQVVVDPTQAQRGTRQVGRELDKLDNQADILRRTLQDAFAFVSVAAATATLAGLTREVLRFNTALAEVSTLVVGTDFNLRQLEEGLLRQAAAFGALPANQVGAAYDIISAGAGSAAEALEILEASNRLAIGGVTDVGTAADGVTSILNAYGDSVGTAADVSDTFFVGVRAGKTRVDLLAQSLGKVAPLAASAGVSFDELVSSVAALTAGGISTRESVTGVRAILAAVVKPTVQAEEASRRLGLEFNAAALESKGFAVFLQEVLAATNGSSDEIAQLFGGVEALIPILALTGEAGDKFADTLDQMANKAGATDDAFNQLANSPGFQLDRVVSNINVEFTKLIKDGLQAVTPAIKALADNMAILFDIMQALALVISVNLVAGALAGLLTSLRVHITTVIAYQRALGATTTSSALFSAATIAAQRAVNGLTAAIAANPFGLLLTVLTSVIALVVFFGDKIAVSADGIVNLQDVGLATFQLLMEAIQPVIDLVNDGLIEALNFIGLQVETLGEAFQVAFNFVLDVLRNFVNNQVALFVGGFNAVIAVWDQLPGAFGNLGALAINALVTVVDAGIKKLVTAVGDLLEFLGGAFEAVGLENPFANLLDDFNTGLSAFKQEVGNEAANVGIVIADEFKKAFERDFVGEALGVVNQGVTLVMDRARTIAEARRTPASAESGTVASIIEDESPVAQIDKESQARADRAAIIQREIDLLDQETMALGLIGDERQVLLQRLSVEEELRNALREANAELTEEELNQLSRLTAAEAARLEQSTLAALAAQRRSSLEEELNGVLREQELRLIAAEELLAQGAISRQQFANVARDAAMAQREFNIEIGQGTFADGFILSLDRMSGRVKSFQSEVGTIFGDMFAQLGKGFADTIGRGIFDTENLGEALKSVARDAISQLISSLIQLGLQYAANQLIATTLGAAATGFALQQATLLASAWAPAAAFASLATAGGNAIPANAALAGSVGLAEALAVAGSAFKNGADFITGQGSSLSDGNLALLSTGEGVVTARANRMNAGAVRFMNEGGQVEPSGAKRPVQVTFNFGAGSDVDSFRKSRRQITLETQRALEVL